MKSGYPRASSWDQNLEPQLDALQKAGCKKILKDNAGPELFVDSENQSQSPSPSPIVAESEGA